MWEPFTEKARLSIVKAQEEAVRGQSNAIDSQHLLLGLLGMSQSDAVKMLEGRGLSVEQARSDVEAITGPPSTDKKPPGEMVFTPTSKHVIELAFAEARAGGDGFIGTQHLLLGLMRAEEGVAFRVLSQHGFDPEGLRAGMPVEREA